MTLNSRPFCVSHQIQPPDLVLRHRHCVHWNGLPVGLRTSRGSLREQPSQVGLCTLQCPVKVCAADVHLGWMRAAEGGQAQGQLCPKSKASDSVWGRLG